MRILFAGTPDFAVPVLQALLNASHQVVAVYTQPDRPKGRGRHVQMSPVKQLALQYHLPVEQPLTLKEVAVQEQLAAYQADVMVVVAYGLLLPTAVLSLPRLGCINVHASLLPRWRGASPIAQAILAGDEYSGVTIMQMVLALDAGDILASAPTKLTPCETSQTLHDRLAVMGADLVISVLQDMERGVSVAKPQNAKLATYAKKIMKEDAQINWHLPARTIEKQIRAYYGWPVAHTYYHDKLLRIWQAKVLDEVSTHQPGQLIMDNHTLKVVCGSGVLQVEQLQLAGGKIILAQDFLNAQRQVKNNVNYFGS